VRRARPSSLNAAMGTLLTVKVLPSRRERRRGATAARSGETDLGFSPTPRRGEHCQAHDHASKEEAGPVVLPWSASEAASHGFHLG
jgi:hypothetical protein